MPLLRVPYTDPLPLPKIIPRSANTTSGAIAALTDFLSAPPSSRLKNPRARNGKTLLLTGAGISVASGLADYRGANGTYTLNKAYRPVYYHEFTTSHEARKRYWARSFLGWTTLHKAKPNEAHWAVKRLGELGRLSSVITQNVDSFHPRAHPQLPTLELHGYLRSLVCLSCRNEYSREAFQRQLAALNPAWAAFLDEAIASGALETENPEERRKRGLRSNPDGDVDLPNAPYSSFRYPACPTCLENPPPLLLPDGRRAEVRVDNDGAWVEPSTAGVLKPAVVLFGESIPPEIKMAAEETVDGSSRVLVVGSSLATYSAWRLVKRAKENGMPIGILNLGGVRGEETFFSDVPLDNTGSIAVRCSESADKILPSVVRTLEDLQGMRSIRASAQA
ncbi:DHS-like NAD/FAD-binding domain-containing protein [Glonium stellatum]|uniref:DHS-like NAD/FAD-binding domain-containing protein n=1 Tax=Glonium stellatum TaxID=574774 RepID=A0A8E2JNW5_9PEZI|nr:DHS-like NAD/FAD-binding domain-containing protein [Glonium stellatum]